MKPRPTPSGPRGRDYMSGEQEGPPLPQRNPRASTPSTKRGAGADSNGTGAAFTSAGDVGAVALPLRPTTPLLETAKKGLYYGYYLVAVAFVAQFVSAGSQNYVTGPFLKPMTTELDWSRSEYQLARTIGQFAMALIGLYVGGLVDRRGGKLLMQGGAVVLGASLFATSFVQTQWQWLLVNGLAVTTGAALIGNL